MTSGVGNQRGGSQRLPEWIALGLLVLTGIPYGSSGLLVPVYGLAILFVVWVVLLVVVLRWKPEPRWWLLVVPLGAVAAWFAILTAGEAWLDWTA